MYRRIYVDSTSRNIHDSRGSIFIYHGNDTFETLSDALKYHYFIFVSLYYSIILDFISCVLYFAVLI